MSTIDVGAVDTPEIGAGHAVARCGAHVSTAVGAAGAGVTCAERA